MSNNNNIGEPDKFELWSVVTKNSRSGITSNRRLLVIKGGKLYYYSNIPKGLSNNTTDLKALELDHQLPKCSIDIVNIKNINEFDLNSSFFSIEFNTKHMMEKEDIRNSVMNMDYNFTPKDTTEQVTWQFTCDNQFIKKRWVRALKSLKDYYKEEDVKIQKFMQNIENNGIHPNEDVKSSSYSSRSSIRMPIPWRESNFSRRSYNPDKPVDFKQSPKQSNNKIEEPTFLKKGKSDLLLKREDQHQQFEMVIKEKPNEPMNIYASNSNPNLTKKGSKVEKIEEVFKGAINNKQETQQRKIKIDSKLSSPLPLPTPLSVPIAIEEVSEELLQTAHKDHNISYSDSEDPTERRKSLEKNHHNEQNKSKMPKNLQFYHSFSIEVPGLPSIAEDPRNSIELRQPYSKSLEAEDPQMKILETSLAEPIQQIKFIEGKDLVQSDKSIQNPYSEDQAMYRFEWLWGESCRNTATFEERINTQKKFLTEMLYFRERAIESLSSWLDSKTRGEERYPIIEETNRYLLLEAGNIQLKIAVVNTQKLVINNSSKIFYNEDSIKNLKREFKIYQNLFKLISKQLKTQPKLKLRIPLSIYIQYKGVCCIASRHHPQQNQLSTISQDLYQNQHNVLISEGYKPQWFHFKQVSKYLIMTVKAKGKNLSTDDESLKDYLKKVILLGRKEKNHNLVFDPPINSTFLNIASKESASTSIQSLQRYVKGLRLAKSLQGPCPKEEIIQALNYCIFCKQLRKVYRSAQGEIGQTHFFNLIFKKDPSMLNLLHQSDCDLPPRIHGQLFSFIEHYFGITLELDQKAFKEWHGQSGPIPLSSSAGSLKKDIFVSSVINPLVREYSLEGFEVIESYSKLPLYIENKHQLAGAALEKKKEIYRMIETLPLALYLELLYDEANYLYHESDFTGCIKKCKEYEASCPTTSINLFPLYLLMMKAYSQFSESDFSKIFQKANQLIHLNYSENNSCLINLYSLASFYYQKLSQNNPHLKQISVKIMKEAQQVCTSLFGSNSKQSLDIILDTSRLYSKLDVSMALAYLDQAKKMLQSTPSLFSEQNLLSVLSYETELHLKRGLISQAQVSLSHILPLLSTKLPLKTKIHLFKLQYQVGFYAQKYDICEEAIEKLWELDTHQKAEALGMAYKMAFKETGISQAENLVDENNSIRFESQQKGLICIEQEKRQFNSLVQLLVTAIQTSNSKIMTLAYYLIHNQ